MKFDVSKLTDDQLRVAEMIIKEAEAQGVNPDLVLPMAYVESRFNPNVKDSEAGAMGVMQLMPGTAKDMKVDPRDLKDNIRGGIKFIKVLMDHKSVGMDPTRLVAAYHMGPDAKFFKTGDPSDIGDQTLAYVDSVNTLSGGVLAPISVGESAGAGEAATAQGEMTPAGSDEAWQASELSTATEDAGPKPYGFSPSTMAAGAIPGATTGAAIGTYQAFRPAATGALSALERLGSAPTAPGTPGAPPAAGGMPPPQGPASRTPAGGQGTFNYAKKFGLTDFDAARAANMSKGPGGSWDVARQVSEAEAKIGPGYRMVPERADLLLPEQVGSGPRGARTVPVPPVPTESPSMLRRAADVMARNPMISRTLGGASLGAQGAEAAERYRSGDIPGAIAMGVGALGSGLSMTPAAEVGIPMSIAGPAAAATMDYYRNRPQPSLENPVISIPATILRDLKQTEQRYQSNLQKARGATGGFSLPPMQ
jgi:hypothetical protein